MNNTKKLPLHKSGKNVQNFNGNSKQSTLLNEINTTSNMNIVDQIGLGTVFKTNISNINLYNENISANKENLNVDNFFYIWN